MSLENPDEREFAERDPKGFLGRFGSGAILDEVLPPMIVFGGEGAYERQGCRVLGWRELAYPSSPV